MPPLPKRKYPKARQGKRRQHWVLQIPQLSENGPDWCPYGSLRCPGKPLAHRACLTCGQYRGRQVFPVANPDTE